MKNKKIVFLSLLISILCLFVGCGKSKNNDIDKNKKDNKNDVVEKKDDEIKVNTNDDVIKEQNIESNLMRNTSLIVEDGISYLTVEVSNPTENDYMLDEYTIIFKDKLGNEIVRIPGYIGDVIKAGDTKVIRSSVNMDLSNAVSIEYIVNK